jgi:hypothetical protein
MSLHYPTANHSQSFPISKKHFKKADRHLSKLHFLSKYLKPKVSTIADTTESVAQTSIDSNR